ncbi:zinc finger protein 391-like [Erpetoichthys calabaricus]|uniref:zinc finger protein 391-like n=1 Tax=Erpetoichthys calabaricus TaxID=27687 RepID=UPI0010A0C052|nr:zinc finger protein 391-like [Erpetoichthys calabaricus]
MDVNVFKEQVASLRAAVDAVLCDFAEFVNKRFTHLQLEITGKDKEIEYLRQCLKIYNKERGYEQSISSPACRGIKLVNGELTSVKEGSINALSVRTLKDTESDCLPSVKKRKAEQTKKIPLQNEPGLAACKKEDEGTPVPVLGRDAAAGDTEVTALLETERSNSKDIFYPKCSIPGERSLEQELKGQRGVRVHISHASEGSTKSSHWQINNKHQQSDFDKVKAHSQKSGPIKQESYGADCAVSHFISQTSNSACAPEHYSTRDQGTEAVSFVETEESNSEETFSQEFNIAVKRSIENEHFKKTSDVFVQVSHSSEENVKSGDLQSDDAHRECDPNNLEAYDYRSGQIKEESYGNDGMVLTFMPQTAKFVCTPEHFSANDPGKHIMSGSLHRSLPFMENEQMHCMEGVDTVHLDEQFGNWLNNHKKQLCGFGNRNLTEKSDARTHMGKKNFQCSECGKKCKTSGTLKNHQRIHTGEKPFVCGQCNSAFNQLSHLKQHQRIHTGERPYSCTVCKSSFNRLSHLKAHQRIHTGERPYNCSECGKAFRQLNILQSHQRIHTGEKPYSCPHCSSTFKQLSNLKRHMQVHSGRKPYACETCGKPFSQLSVLQRHYQIHLENPI